MKIRYNKKQLKLNLVLGIVWLCIGIVQLYFIKGALKWHCFIWFFLPALYFYLYVKQRTGNYLSY